jgi:hypothetical protein
LSLLLQGKIISTRPSIQYPLQQERWILYEDEDEPTTQPTVGYPDRSSHERSPKKGESRAMTEDQKTLMDWMTRCDAIAGSASYVVNGYPELQVPTLKGTLKRAAADGVDWRVIYRSIYEQWHTRRPHFPDLETMTAEMERPDCP